MAPEIGFTEHDVSICRFFSVLPDSHRWGMAWEFAGFLSQSSQYFFMFFSLNCLAGIYESLPYRLEQHSYALPVYRRYWHRPLNPRKLVDVGFSHLTRTMTLHRAIKLYRLPDTTSLPGFRVLESRDLPACRQLLATYLESRSHLHPVFSEEEFSHWLVATLRLAFWQCHDRYLYTH